MERKTNNDSGEESCTSADFNPLAALYSEATSVPYPNVTKYDNVAVFESRLNRSSSSSKPKTARSSASDTQSAHSSTMRRLVPTRGPVPSTMAKKRKEAFVAMGIKMEPTIRKDTTTKNLFSRLKGDYFQGPLAMLTRCIGENLLVKVCTRNRHEIRGHCKGYIVAFDKHMNMAMVDVEETYRNPLWESKSGRRRRRQALKQQEKLDENVEKGDKSCKTEDCAKKILESKHCESLSDSEKISMKSLTLGEPSQTKATSSKNHLYVPKDITRHINQLFIRGDTVVTVIPIK